MLYPHIPRSLAGGGGNRPDAKLLIDYLGKTYPVLIEYKGHNGKLVKLDKDGKVDNSKQANIVGYAVNGAVHYADALLHYTHYTDIIAIGMTGFRKADGSIQHEIGVYLVSKDALGAPQKVGDYTDFSFLAPKHRTSFIEKVENLKLSPEELERIRELREQQIDDALVKLNNHIYKSEQGLNEQDRVNLVAASIMATLGEDPLPKDDLKGKTGSNTDGHVISRKVNDYLKERQIPEEKRESIMRMLDNTLLNQRLSIVEDDETPIKRIFTRIVEDLGYYYKIGLTTDFTGKLFNEMYSWMGFTQDKLNDVVLTPSYVAKLLVKLARVNKDSYVWDFATGSGGLLVAAMNEMLEDARTRISSPKELQAKEEQIKGSQLMGIEHLQSVYMLAILNMILMGDGSSNILHDDSLKFDGKYAYGPALKTVFPANAFVLNPPYSAEGNGMVFVERALDYMERGWAAIIIQSSAGSGKAKDINRSILENNTLVASIKMPDDLFLGKSSVNTRIYVFEVGIPHQESYPVKFIDFSNDGYTRGNRKKAKKSVNLRDTGNAKERYAELVRLVQHGQSQLNIFTTNEYYEGTIDPTSGEDWNQSAPIDITPTLEDFKNTISEYLSWEVSKILKGTVGDDSLGK
ncbi:MAG: N-6 DNA methylase [Rothia sp. (in: high G+C Gram-positive bacteria)]|uniref:HsdM family class I SAM-dependent methyltransferase n=1 Tax=Rothia sp. (in: high G+C Gram-positive bacteria) TaxID=1885016 RepID=UPI0026E09B8C|nr:N-6 DNA methylase [Rothia sp. (in: high G+C Gram-positive bacteria)]MDO5750634.1 N-6 DNA methylase [Rothia sp. (in: high G+C Gram-positive bacteria)]